MNQNHSKPPTLHSYGWRKLGQVESSFSCGSCVWTCGAFGLNLVLALLICHNFQYFQCFSQICLNSWIFVFLFFAGLLDSHTIGSIEWLSSPLFKRCFCSVFMFASDDKTSWLGVCTPYFDTPKYRLEVSDAFRKTEHECLFIPRTPRRGSHDNSPPGMKLNEIPLGTAGNWDPSIQKILGFQVGLGERSMFHYSKNGSRTVGNCRMFESFVTWNILWICVWWSIWGANPVALSLFRVVVATKLIATW